MKRYTKYSIKVMTAGYILTGIVSLTGCEKFLSENPKDRLMQDETISNVSDLYKHSVATLYNNIGGYNDSEGLQGTGRGIYDLNTFTTDEAIMPTRGTDWYDGGFWQGLFLHDWGTNNNSIYATWEYLYKSINQCNESLKRIDIYKNNNPEDDINSLRAEVRALRGLFYYYTMDLFGRIPVLDFDENGKTVFTQQDRSRVFRYIVNDLQEALPYLSDERSNTPGEYYGRITRPVAYFLLAKLALNAEIYTDDNWTDNIKYDGKNILFDIENSKLNAWETVVYYCDRIKDLGYELEKDYRNNFAVFNESSKENIFVIPMNKTLYTNQFIYLFRSRHYNHAKAYGLGGENGASATKETLEVFGYDTPDEDPRFDFCYFDDNLTDLNGNPIMLDDGKTRLVYEPWKVELDVSGKPYEKTAGARMKKYEVDNTAFKDGKLIDNDIVLFRYADVLLMKCEAKIRNGENGDAELKEIRDRVNAAYRPATLENIYNERLLELAWEGWRRQDMIRFGKYTESYSFRPELENEDNGYTTVFPIPEKFIQMNNGIKQNYGYTKQ